MTVESEQNHRPCGRVVRLRFSSSNRREDAGSRPHCGSRRQVVVGGTARSAKVRPQQHDVATIRAVAAGRAMYSLLRIVSATAFGTLSQARGVSGAAAAFEYLGSRAAVRVLAFIETDVSAPAASESRARARPAWGASRDRLRCKQRRGNQQSRARRRIVPWGREPSRRRLEDAVSGALLPDSQGHELMSLPVTAL